MKVDLFMPTYNRKEFTKTALECLMQNSHSTLVNELLVIDAYSEDGTDACIKKLIKNSPFATRIVKIKERHVVKSMLLARDLLKAEIIGKIDSDTMVSPGWLSICTDVMERNPELEGLGIAPRGKPESDLKSPRRVKRVGFVGGIGLFRKSAWANLKARKPPYWGWCQHQWKTRVKVGWLIPCLPIFLLNQLPFDPYLSLSMDYIKRGWQRAAPHGSSEIYLESQEDLWAWRFPDWKRDNRS